MMHLFKKITAPAAGPIDFIIVGLGNPGKQYENTRHNVGFTALDHIAKTYNCAINKLKYKSLYGTCRIDGHGVLLMKPQTYMNNSGEAVIQAMSFYKIPPERVLVLFDDISLEPGKLRIRRKGSDGGQKGMRSIIQLSGKDTFPRIKIGIGAKPNPQWELADWVLSRFTKSEAEQMEKAAEAAGKAAALIISGETDKAMNLYNS